MILIVTNAAQEYYLNVVIQFENNAYQICSKKLLKRLTMKMKALPKYSIVPNVQQCIAFYLSIDFQRT